MFLVAAALAQQGAVQPRAQPGGSWPIEPWYERMNHFGPTSADGNWSPHAMVLLAPYCHEILLTVKGGQEFLFVSSLAPSQPVPPLGPLNWKQGKIGCGAVIPSVLRGGRYAFRAVPGGQSGRFPASGTVLLRVCTNATMTISMEYAAPLVEAPTLQALDSSVTSKTSFRLLLTAPNFTQSLLRVANGVITNVTRGASARTFVLSVRARDQGTGTVGYGEISFDVLVTKLATKGFWSKPVTLRDNSRAFDAENKPDGGWYVTPIHANVVRDGPRSQVLISGWLRRDSLPCGGGNKAGGRRRAGLSFLVDPDDVRLASGELRIKRIDEDAEASFEKPAGKRQDGYVLDGDAIYCAGHTTLPDGRVFFVGGGRYSNVSSPYEHEWGLDYARLFDPKTKTFKRVQQKIPLGTTWYPTAGLLPSGKVLVTGAFSSYASDKCLGDSCLNSQINVFDANALDAGRNPWSVLIGASGADNDWAPGVREYTRVFVLPNPKRVNGVTYDVLLMGKKGRVVLLSTATKQVHKPAGGLRPAKCSGDRSDQSSFVPLTIRGGEALVIGGGCDDDSLSSADFYNVASDSWSSIDLGIQRRVPAAVFLADGRVAVLSGEPVSVDQNLFAKSDAPSDTRYVQVIDPVSKTVETEQARGSLYRGYHNMAALLRDGSLLVGGGYSQLGDVGCEEPTLQLFNPSYIASGRERPLFHNESETLKLVPGSRFVIRTKQGSVTPVSVSLVAVQAFTHSYGQNQRHVTLPIVQVGQGNVTVEVPAAPIVFPGHYNLFLIARSGAPSLSAHAVVQRSLGQQEERLDMLEAGLARKLDVTGLGNVLTPRRRRTNRRRREN